MNPLTVVPALSYHQLASSDARHRWWRPLVVGLVAAGLYGALMVVLLIVGVLTSLAVPRVDTVLQRFFAEPLDLGDPVAFALLLASVALMLPALLVATRLTGSRPVGLLSSVAGRLRWKWLWTTTALAFAVWLPVMAAWLAYESVTGTLEVRQVAPATMITLLATTLLLVPFQAAAEECVFRGYLAQALGSWLRHPAFAVLLPVPLFVAGHGYGLLGAIDVGVFAVVCGWLAWRTGGLEAPIAAHVANNMVLMALSAVGLGDPNATNTTPAGLAFSLGLMAVFTVVAVRRADAMNIARTRSIPESSAQQQTAEAAMASAGR